MSAKPERSEKIPQLLYHITSIISMSKGCSLTLIFSLNLHTSKRRVVGPSRNKGGRSGVSKSSLFSLYQFSIPGNPCSMRWATTVRQRSGSPHFSTDKRHWSTADPHSLLKTSGRKKTPYEDMVIGLQIWVLIQIIPSFWYWRFNQPSLHRCTQTKWPYMGIGGW